LGKGKQDLMQQIKKETESLPEFFSSIETVEDAIFDREVERRLSQINESAKLIPEHREELMRWCYELSGRELDSSIVMKHAREKPLGYPGDFRLIDMLYKNKPCSQGKGLLWDKMFLRQPAAHAVRNRKKFFAEMLYSSCQENDKTSVLSLACGSCHEVLEAMRTLNTTVFNCSFHFVDQDRRAIEHSKSLFNGDFSDSLELKWEVANVFHIRPKQKYSLIWVSGLFDYLDNRLATALLGRMWHWLDNGGRIIIGNFHPRNPNRNQMEWCLGWFLIHRMESEMAEICNRAGIPADSVSFEPEPLGINIFLVIYKKEGSV